MKSIIIKEENKELINRIISEAEGRSTVRKIDYDDCVAAVKDIDEKLNLPQKAKSGISAYIDVHASIFSITYHGDTMSTKIKVMYKNRTWQLIDVYRGRTCSYNRKYQVRLTETAVDELTSRRLAECTCFR